MLTLACWPRACAAAAAQALRPEVGKPLQQAGELLKAGKSKEALAKVREADAVPNKTPAEQLTIDRMRGAAAQRAGDHATAIQAFEAVFACGKLSRRRAGAGGRVAGLCLCADQGLAKAQAWIAKAQAAGGNSAQLKQLQAYAAGPVGRLRGHRARCRRGGEQRPSRPASALPRPTCCAWPMPTSAPTTRPTRRRSRSCSPTTRRRSTGRPTSGGCRASRGFADRFALDVMRLKLATGTMSKTDDFMEMAQLALQAGYPAEARKIVERGLRQPARWAPAPRPSATSGCATWR